MTYNGSLQMKEKRIKNQRKGTQNKRFAAISILTFLYVIDLFLRLFPIFEIL